MREVTLAEITQALGGTLHGNADRVVLGIGSLEAAGQHDIAYMSHARLADQLGQCQAACVIVAPAQSALAAARGDYITAEQPQLYFARLTQWWVQRMGLAVPAGIHPSAVVHPSAEIDPSASVGALSVIEAGVRVGAHTRIGQRVTIERNCVIGARCVILSGAVIGADGFGFAVDGKKWVKIEQFGAVRLGDDVEIGANTTVDRGALGDTIIGDGVKLDNQIQIGHNCQIGENTAMAACVGVSGSTRVGANCTLAGGVGVAGHLEIVDNTHVSGATAIYSSLTQPGRYTGVYPYDLHSKWEQSAVLVRQLKKMRDRIRKLEKELAAKP